MTNKCSVCGMSESEESAYCSECGAKLGHARNAFYCVRCGQALQDEARFCAYCREPVPYMPSSGNDEYTRLVSQAIHGDIEAFQSLYERRFNDLYYIALSLLKNPHDAEDMTQNTFIQAWKSIGSLQSPYAFKGWITRILRNCCMDLIRKNKPMFHESDDVSFEETLYEDDIEFLPADILEKKETQRLVREIVDGLPDAQRQTIVLHYFQLLPIIDIAGIMSVSEGTVKSRLHYGRMAVKEGVEAHEKQGVKLYSIAGLPLLYLILREGAAQVALSPARVAGLWQSASSALGIGVGTGSATPTKPCKSSL